MTSKTLKEFAEDLEISKKYLQNKINYETKKQNLEIGFWETIGGKRTRLLSDQHQDLILKWLRQSGVSYKETKGDTLEDNLGDNQFDLLNAESKRQIEYLKERISNLERLLEREQNASGELRILLKHAQDHSEKRQLELQQKNSKGFWKRLFGK